MTGVGKRDNMDYSMSSEETRRVLSMEAILARDQRTTSHRVKSGARYGDQEISSNSSNLIGVKFGNVDKAVKVSTTSFAQRDSDLLSNSTISRNIRHSSSKRIRGRSSYRGFTLTWLRLGSLLVTLLVASINGAPTMNSKNDARFNTQPKWVNPCELQETIELNDTDVVQLTDHQLLSQIVVQAKTAHMEAKIFREKFIKKVFQVERFEDWKSQHYEWLPSKEQIPKDLDEQLDPKFLEKLDLDTALLDAYEYMQKYAVALEQVVWDQIDQKLPLSENFSSTEDKLRMVLCEIQVALVERQVPQRKDVSRSIMKEDFRKMSNEDTQRDLRDWLIFRDYMNGLQYVDQVFDYFRNKTDS